MLSDQDNDYKVEFTYATIGFRSFPYAETQSYVGSTAYAKTVTKTVDANGNKATEAYPSSLSLAYAWNDIDNLSSISDGTNTIASDAWIGSRRKTETFQSGAVRTNYYTGFRDEIESVRHETSGSATILRLDYGYNAVHDRTYERFGASGSSGDAFEYDKLRRLTVAWMGSTTPSSPSGNAYTKKIEYNYDDDGNRTSVVTTPYQQSPQTSSYSTNSLNEYTSVGGTSQSSDSNGNLVDNGTYLFLYDYRNHIVQVKLKSDSSVVATYKYDPLGRRVEKNVGGTVERYILSIANPVGAVEDLSNVVTVYDGSDNWLQNFVWSDEPDGIQMLEQKDVLDYDSDGNTTEVTRSFYHRNALGSVMEITDMNQAEVVSYRYDPYGKVTITRAGVPQSSDPLGNHWTFTGRFLDEESGLLYYRARHYDPMTGRFLQRDPRGYAEAPAIFEYADSNPSTVRDPSGCGDKENQESLTKEVERFLAAPLGPDDIVNRKLTQSLPGVGATLDEGGYKKIKELLGGLSDPIPGIEPRPSPFDPGFGGAGGAPQKGLGGLCGTPWVHWMPVGPPPGRPDNGGLGGGGPPSKGKWIKNLLTHIGIPTELKVGPFKIEPDVWQQDGKTIIGIRFKNN
jgi:RHS repeat-associated protein